MFKILLLGFVFFPNIFPASVGEWLPLCEKYTQSDLVFVMEFRVEGAYSDEYREKQGAPPASDLRRGAATGKVVDVLKGDGLEAGALWEPGFGYPFYHHASVAYWDAFFRRPSFQMVYFLKQTQQGYQFIGGGETQEGCSGSSHFSWCSSYGDYLRQVSQCSRCEGDLGESNRVAGCN